jgi:hypothetical protein
METNGRSGQLSLSRATFKVFNSRALRLSADYWKSTQTLTNAAMIDESQKAIKQADGITDLTTLAFIFIPLTFTACFWYELGRVLRRKLREGVGICADYDGNVVLHAWVPRLVLLP